MSRRTAPKIDINKIIDLYKESKDKENALKKSNTEMGNNIKTYFKTNGLDRIDTDKYTATVITSTSESLNEELAIEIIKENLGGAMLATVIKTKEYIDEDALEKLVYNGDFDINKFTLDEITSIAEINRLLDGSNDILVNFELNNDINSAKADEIVKMFDSNGFSIFDSKESEPQITFAGRGTKSKELSGCLDEVCE